jgi:hypothetical protein
MQTIPKCPIRSFADVAIWYGPGGAAPCRAIVADPEQVYAHTNRGSCVAIVTDGTRVLGHRGKTGDLPRQVAGLHREQRRSGDRRDRRGAPGRRRVRGLLRSGRHQARVGRGDGRGRRGLRLREPGSGDLALGGEAGGGPDRRDRPQRLSQSAQQLPRPPRPLSRRAGRARPNHHGRHGGVGGRRAGQLCPGRGRFTPTTSFPGWTSGTFTRAWRWRPHWLLNGKAWRGS